ncbi:MAG TPA: hypothetical protein VI076_01755 [Actinopolymorphaceae bacterium]
MVGSARGRQLVTSLLLVFGCLAAAVAVPAWWFDRQLSTEAYVRTSAPIAADPSVRRALAVRAAEVTLEGVDIDGQVRNSLLALSALGLPEQVLTELRGVLEPADDALRALVEKEIEAAIAGPVGEQVWRDAVRELHAAVTDPAADGDVVVDIAPLVDDVHRRLTATGLRLTQEVTPEQTRLTLVDADRARALRQARERVVGIAVPALFVTSVLLGSALVVSPRRRTTLVATGIFLAGVMLASIAVLAATRERAVEALVGIGLPRAAAGTVFDTYADALRTDYLWMLGVAAGIAVVVTLVGFGARTRTRTPPV